jgi:peptide/nickel transport system substrate-binding protein
MKYLFNREQMVKTIMLGHGVLANDQPIHPSMRFYAKGLKQRPYDPDKAKWHFQRANLPAGPIPMVASPVAAGSVEIALILQHEARKLGVNFDVRRMPSDGYWSQHWMKHPVGFGMIQPRPSADVMLSLFFKSDAPQNESGWKNEKFDQLLLAARAEIDDAKRAAMYADLQALVHDQSGIGIPYFMSALDGHSKKLRGLSPIPLGGLMGFSFAEHVWLEA